MWLLFISVVIALLVFDLGVLHKDDHEIGVAESLKLSAMYIALGVAFRLSSGGPTTTRSPGPRRMWPEP